MVNLIMIVVLIISGLVWLFDAFTGLQKRKRLDQAEPEYIAFSRGIFLILAVISVIRFTDIGILPLLTILTVVSFIIWIVDRFTFAKARLKAQKKEPLLVDYAKSLFPVFLIVLVIRAFIIQPFRVPTGSLEPTVMPNDFLAVSQFAYGLRLPITHTKILSIGEPKRGDIAVFRYPANPKLDYVKRIIGVPGDHVVYKNKVLYINGIEAKQTNLGPAMDVEPGGNIPSMMYEEDLLGVKHKILIHNQGGEMADFDVTVPQGHYFAMGDNRDNSGDSRVWGFVPEKNLIGQAFMVFLAWDKGVNWKRIGNKL
jgi:signal peptidase I